MYLPARPGGMRGAFEFAVPDEVGVLGVILAMANVQTLCQTLSGRGTLPKPLPPDPAHSVDETGGMQKRAFRRSGVTGPSPFRRLGSPGQALFSGSGGYFCQSCFDKADSAKIVIP